MRCVSREFKGLSRVFQKSLNGVSSMFQESFRGFTEVPRVLPGRCFKGVLRVFDGVQTVFPGSFMLYGGGCFKEVSNVFQENFKGD